MLLKIFDANNNWYYNTFVHGHNNQYSDTKQKLEYFQLAISDSFSEEAKEKKNGYASKKLKIFASKILK